MNTESITPSEPCCRDWQMWGDHNKECKVYQDLPECYSCGEKMTGEVRQYLLPGDTEPTERHPACCPSIVYVNAYRVTLAYGGAEEGGWWYDEGEPLGSIPIDLKTNPSAFIEHYKLLFKDVQVRTKSSMGGSDLVIRVEDHQAEYFPATRPHYE